MEMNKLTSNAFDIEILWHENLLFGKLLFI